MGGATKAGCGVGNWPSCGSIVVVPAKRFSPVGSMRGTGQVRQPASSKVASAMAANAARPLALVLVCLMLKGAVPGAGACPVAMKLFWGVYNQAMKLVAKYDYTQKKAAEQKAEALSASGKTPHFVAKVKEAVEG